MWLPHKTVYNKRPRRTAGMYTPVRMLKCVMPTEKQKQRTPEQKTAADCALRLPKCGLMPPVRLVKPFQTTLRGQKPEYAAAPCHRFQRHYATHETLCHTQKCRAPATGPAAACSADKITGKWYKHNSRLAANTAIHCAQCKEHSPPLDKTPYRHAVATQIETHSLEHLDLQESRCCAPHIQQKLPMPAATSCR